MTIAKNPARADFVRGKNGAKFLFVVINTIKMLEARA